MAEDGEVEDWLGLVTVLCGRLSIPQIISCAVLPKSKETSTHNSNSNSSIGEE